MPEYSITPSGPVIRGKYTRWGVLSTSDILKNNIKTIDLLEVDSSVKQPIRYEYNIRSKIALIRQIFFEFIERMLEDVADGHIFLFPGAFQAHIFLEETPKEEVKYLRQRGYFKDYDIVRARYRIPRFRLKLGPTSKAYAWQVRVPPKIRDKALRNVEEDKIPFRKLLKKI